MAYTHKPTNLPGSDPASDRCAYHDGKIIGRVIQIDQGSRQGRWSWAGRWMGPGNGGVVETLDQALGDLKETHKSLTPDQIKSLGLLE